MNQLIPYSTLVGDITLEVLEARLDGVPLNFNMVSSSRRVVALHQIEREDWEEARLSVRLSPPRHELEVGSWSDIVCVAVSAERRTNTRTVTPLKRLVDGGWAGVVPLHSDHHRGYVELSGHVIATVDGVVGRLIGSTKRPWTVDLQARTPNGQQAMKIVSVDFGDEAHPYLAPYKSDPWMIEAGADEPIVYLNTGFEGLCDLLDSGDRTVRESLSAQIAADAWTALFNAAVYAAEIEDEQPQWPSGWRASVLKRMLPDMFPDRSPDDALMEIVSRRLDGNGGGDLQTRLVHAAGVQARVSRYLGGFLRGISRKEHA